MPQVTTPNIRSDQPDRLWTIPDVARFCCRSRRTIERWMEHHKLPHHKLPSGQIVFRPDRIKQHLLGQERW